MDSQRRMIWRVRLGRPCSNILFNSFRPPTTAWPIGSKIHPSNQSLASEQPDTLQRPPSGQSATKYPPPNYSQANWQPDTQQQSQPRKWHHRTGRKEGALYCLPLTMVLGPTCAVGKGDCHNNNTQPTQQSTFPRHREELKRKTSSDLPEVTKVAGLPAGLGHESPFLLAFIIFFIKNITQPLLFSLMSQTTLSNQKVCER